MKKQIAAAIGCLLSATLSAQTGTGNNSLQVQFTDRTPVAVSVDGQFYDDQGDMVVVDNLTAGNHEVKVYRANSSRTRTGMRPPSVKTFTVRIKPGSTTTADVEPDGSAVDIHSEAVYTRTDRRDDQRYDDRDDNGRDQPQDDRMDRRDDRRRDMNDGDDMDRDDRPRRYREDRTYRERRDDDRMDRDDYNDRGRRRYYHRRWDDRRDEAEEAAPLSATDVANIKIRAQKKATDASKIETIEDEIGERPYTTEQVRTMLRWIKAEKSRLDFVKWAYDGVIDPENYKKLATEFKLATSKAALKKLSATTTR